MTCTTDAPTPADKWRPALRGPHAPMMARARSLLTWACAPLLLGAWPALGQLPARGADGAALERAGSAGPHGRRPRKGELESGVVSIAWLAAHLSDCDLVLLHVGREDGYRATHIPGARHLAFQDLSAKGPGWGPGRTLLPQDLLRERLEALGISDESRIIVYFDKDWTTRAARVLFTLDAMGLGARAALLDGGLPEWIRSGLSVTTEVPAPAAPGRIRPVPYRRTVVDAALVDPREPSRATVVAAGERR